MTMETLSIAGCIIDVNFNDNDKELILKSVDEITKEYQYIAKLAPNWTSHQIQSLVALNIFASNKQKSDQFNHILQENSQLSQELELLKQKELDQAVKNRNLFEDQKQTIELQKLEIADKMQEILDLEERLKKKEEQINILIEEKKQTIEMVDACFAELKHFDKNG